MLASMIVSGPAPGPQCVALIPIWAGREVSAEGVYFSMGYGKKRCSVNITERKGAGKKILLVDDDRGVTEVCMQMLRHYGYDVTSYATGEEAIEAFAQERFDLVIMDIGLPGKDGWRCAGEMLSRRGDVKILLSSGNCRDESEQQPKAAGSVKMLNKPFTMQELIGTVSDLIAA